MKYLLQKHDLLLRIMKISITQACLFLLIVGVSYGTRAPGQSLLEKQVTLHVQNKSLSTVLSEIEKMAGVKFMYSPKIVQSQRQISVSARKKPLGEVFQSIFQPLALDYRLNGDHVIISPVNEKGSSLKQLSPQQIFNEQQLDRTITGKVTDESGEGLPGVNIILMGTQTGTISEPDGSYSLTIDDSNRPVLVFSFVGYATQQTEVGLQTFINITLQAEDKALQEVVVVGYGTQKKATLTGSIAVTKGEDLKKSPAVNLSNSLAGRLPGIIASNRSGQPGSGSSILIRGQSTLGNNSPLIVIDGVWGRSGFEQINPNDVESISVLKDASAAIYGAQAANGVILITTKRGNTGKPSISYTMNQGFSKPTRLAKMADAATYAGFMNELYNYQGQPDRFTDDEIRKLRDGSDPVKYPNTNWSEQAFKKMALQSQHNLSVRGGTETIKYYLSGSYSNQDNILKNSNIAYSNFSIRSNVDAQINKSIKIGLDFAARDQDKTLPSMGTSSIFHTIWRNYPFLRAYNPDGSVAPGIERGENPLIMGTGAAGYNKEKNNLYQTTLTYDIKLPWVNGLGVDGFIAYDRDFTHSKLFRKPWTVYDYNPDTDQYTSRLGGSVTNPELTETYNGSSRTTVNFRARYDVDFGSHSLSSFVAVEQTETKGDNFWALRKNYLTSTIDQLYAGGAADKDNSGTGFETARRNLFGRVNYGFKDKYLIDFSFRYDGSQNFPAGNRYGFFPGVSAGWRLSEEDFIRNIPAVDNLKIRASFGKMGNDQVDAFQYLSTYTFGTGYYFADPVTSLNRGITPNTNITWEVAQTLNMGLEASFWNGLFGIEFDVFKTRRNNILTARNASVPSYTGLKLPNENIGIVENKGFELQLTHTHRTARLPYQLGANISYARNTIIDIDEAMNQQEWQMRTGHPMGTSLYYDALGIYRTQEQIDGSPHPVGTRVGDLQYRDVNGDNVIDAKDQIRNDYTNVPRVSFGFNAGVSYKNFSVNALLQGQTAVKQYIFLQSGLAGNSLQDWIENRYTPENPNSKFPILPTYEAEINGYRSDFWLRDASFLRLKNLEISYTLPASVLESLKIQNLRIYASGFNLITLDKLKYFDPEGNSETGGFYPQEKIYNLGFNITF